MLQCCLVFRYCSGCKFFGVAVLLEFSCSVVSIQVLQCCWYLGIAVVASFMVLQCHWYLGVAVFIAVFAGV